MPPRPPPPGMMIPGMPPRGPPGECNGIVLVLLLSYIDTSVAVTLMWTNCVCFESTYDVKSFMKRFIISPDCDRYNDVLCMLYVTNSQE